MKYFFAIAFTVASAASLCGQTANYVIDNGKSNMAAGFQSLSLNPSCCGTAFGYGTLVNDNATANSAFGANAGQNDTSGSANTFYGAYAGFTTTTGGSNAFTGTYAGYCNLTGISNTATGTDALQGNFNGTACVASNSGSEDTADGNGALFLDTTGSQNTAIGQGALYYTQTTSMNTALGFNAGEYINGAGDNTNPTNGIYVGANSQALSAGDTNEIIIGVNAVGNGSNTATLGNGATTDTYLSGRIHGNVLQSGGTQTISGCSLTSALGGASAGSFHSGTSGTCAITITPGYTASNGWSCWGNDLTTTMDHLYQTGYTTTTATVAGTTVSGDIVTWGCVAF